MKLKDLHEATVTANIAAPAGGFYNKEKKKKKDFGCLTVVHAPNRITSESKDNKDMSKHKIVNSLPKKVWQTIDYGRNKNKHWYNQYAATTSIDKPYATQGL